MHGKKCFKYSLFRYRNRNPTVATELNRKSLKYVDGTPVDVTVVSNTYVSIPNVPGERSYLFATVRNWKDSGEPFSLHGSGRTFYVNAKIGAVVNSLSIRYWYMD